MKASTVSLPFNPAKPAGTAFRGATNAQWTANSPPWRTHRESSSRSSSVNCFSASAGGIGAVF